MKKLHVSAFDELRIHEVLGSGFWKDHGKCQSLFGSG